MKSRPATVRVRNDPGSGNSLIMTEIEPTVLEDLLVLQLEDVLLGEYPARDLEKSAGLINSHFMRVLDLLVHGNPP